MKTRREILKTLALSTVSLPVLSTALATEKEQTVYQISSKQYDKKPIEKPVTFICIGAGNRGQFYSKYAQKHPDEMCLIGVADPHNERRKMFAEAYQIPAENQFLTWEDVFKKPKFADAVIIATPDNLHYAPCMKALEMGYEVILEKPISPSLKECLEIKAQTHKYNRIVAVCHVLRYTNYFVKMKELIDSGIIGDIVSVDHLEPVGYWHMAHSYVRGNWRDEKSSSFMLLAKSCHDTDIIRWLIGKPCRKVASFGSLKHFKPENAPKGSTARCTDGCAVEKECPYSAMRLYLNMERKGWPVSVITTDLSYEGRMKALKETNYGKCVYRSDNNVVDHQVVSMQFDEGITANFTMSGFTGEADMGKRKTRIMGTMGELIGNFQQIEVVNFRNNQKEIYDSQIAGGDAADGHGGGDMNLVRDFIQAVSRKDASLLSSTIDVSIESHVIAFQAEKSRITGQIQPIK